MLYSIIAEHCYAIGVYETITNRVHVYSFAKFVDLWCSPIARSSTTQDRIDPMFQLISLNKENSSL